MTLKLAWGNVRKSLRDFGIYFVTVALGVAVFYAFNSMSAQQGVLSLSERQSSILDLLSGTIGGASVFIAALLVFLVVYANRFLIRRRKKEFGLYLALGMGGADVVRIVLAESLIVGASSLVFGLIAGIGLSQALLYVTSSLFSADVAAEGNLAFVFSPDAFGKAVVVFAGIFALAAVVNARTVARTKLIDLLRADRMVESMAIRSLPVSFALFIVSIVIVGISYRLLVDNGLLSMSPEFAAATALVIVGTALFFYSVSGFLLRAVQFVRPLYLRGLNMFTLRQLGARVNTAVASLTVVCFVLFLAITSVCVGLGLRDATENSLAKGTSYSASETLTLAVTDAGGTTRSLSHLDPYTDFMESVGYDMREGIAQSMREKNLGDFDALVTASAQVDRLFDASDPLTYGSVEKSAGVDLADYASADLLGGEYEGYPVQIMRLSQVNAALALAGKPAIELSPGECAIICDVDALEPFWDAVAASGASLEVGGVPLKVALSCSECLVTTPSQYNAGAVAVADADVPESYVLAGSTLDMQCATDADEAALASALGELSQSPDTDIWPVACGVTTTRAECYEQSVGVSALVSYLAVYLGFVFVVACAAILAIQQLSDAAESARRYKLARLIGASEGMVSGALFAQVLAYFLFPLLLALAHSACALSVATGVISMFGRFDISAVALFTLVAFLVVYGAYFLVTFASARRIIRS